MAKFSSVSGEKALIAALRKQIGTISSSNASIELGIGDDCAILAPPRGHQILITTDFSLETIHFRRDLHSPESVGHRCMARGLSDLAAMGANPIAAFLSLALPLELVQGRRSWRDRFLAGLLALADRFHIPLAGGDTAGSPFQTSSSPASPITGMALADIILIGSARPGRALLRSGAKNGDRIYITGFLGGAAAELHELEANPRKFRNAKASILSNPNPHPHLFPEPRIAIGQWLAKSHRATAAIDLSDGLSTDLDHICTESGLAATIDAAALPLHPLATAGSEALRVAINGGEDYELLFTASSHMQIPRQITGVPITPIGYMRRYNSRTPRILLKELVNGKPRERPMRPGGWEHY